MTEAEWLACTDPQRMLEFIRGKASGRKLRLLAVNCCRRVQHRLRESSSVRALDILEAFADGSVGKKQLKEALWEAEKAAGNPPKGDPFRASAAAWAVVSALQDGFFGESESVLSAAAEASLLPDELRQREEHRPTWPPDKETARHHIDLVWGREHQAQSDLVRDIFGPVAFRRLQVNKAWLRWDGQAVTGIARTIYECRAFNQMLQLADALEYAGCSDTCAAPALTCVAASWSICASA